MTAIMLCAGYAVRLYPFTERFPKPLLPVAGRPVLEPELENVFRVKAVKEVVVVTNARDAPLFQDWLSGYRQRVPDASRIQLLNDGTSNDTERLGAIGDLALALRSSESREGLLLLCADKVFDFELSDLVRFYEERRAPVNACHSLSSAAELRGRYGCLVLGEDGRVMRYEEKPIAPASRIASVAFYVLPAETMLWLDSYLSTGGNPDAPGHFFAWLAQKTQCFGWAFSGRCDDIGTPDSYLRANSGTRTPLLGGILTVSPEMGCLGSGLGEMARRLERALRFAKNNGLLLVELRSPSACMAQWDAVLSAMPTPVPVSLRCYAEPVGSSASMGIARSREPQEATLQMHMVPVERLLGRKGTTQDHDVNAPLAGTW